MTSTGDVVFVGKQLFVGNPPREVTGGNSGDQNLQQVLAISGDAGVLPISNTGTITTAAAPASVVANQADIKADIVETRFVNSSFCSTTEATATILKPPAGVEGALLTVQATTIQKPQYTGAPSLDVTADSMTTAGITVNGEINWTNGSFNPPLVVSGTPSLSQVLGAGGDAGAQGISDLSSLDFEENGGTQTTIVGVPTTLTKCTNLDLSDTTNTHPNLSQVMSGTGNNSVGAVDLDLNQRNIINVNSITSAIVDATGTTGVPIPLVRMFGNDAEIIFDPFATGTKTGTKITGAAITQTKCTNLDITDATNTLPANTLASVLAMGNQAGSNGINMMNQDILDIKDLTANGTGTSITNATLLTADTVTVLASGSLLAGDAASIQLAETDMQGNLNMKGTDNVKHNILEADIIAGQTLSANGFSGNEGRIAAAREMSTSIYTVNQPYAGQPANSGIVFNSLTTAPTQITGVSVTNPTVCTNLDLRSSTNLFTSSPAEIYEWGGYWKNPQTIFPPPPYADPPANPPNYQIPPINQVHLEFVQYDFPGWRYFAPMSDNDCQIDPNDYMDLTNGAYIGGEARGGWPDAFYVETAATTVEAHASQTVELWFPVVEYGYGRIYFGLASRDSTSTSAPTVIPQSFRLWMDSENAPGFGDVRSRMCGMKWHIKDFFPTDGTKLHIFPVCRTDDDETTGGRLIIKIGDGQPRNGCNPGEFPEFDPIDNTAQNGQIIMRGYPEPAQWTNYLSTTPPAWQTTGNVDEEEGA